MIGRLVFAGFLTFLAPRAAAAAALSELQSLGAGSEISAESIPFEWNLRRRDGPDEAEPVLDVHPPIKELSAAVLDPKNSVVWTLGDSGSGAFLGRTPVSLDNGFRPAGETEKIEVAGAVNLDWEALALDADGALWIADCGDNKGARRSVILTRVDTAAASSGRAAASRRIEVLYPDGARDAEASVIAGTRLFLIEKTAWGLARVVWADIAPEAADRQTAQKAGFVDLNLVTDAAVAPGGRVYLLSYDGVWALDGWFAPDQDPANRTLEPDRVAGVKDIVGRNKDWWQFESLIALSDERFLVGEEKGHFFPRTAVPPALR